MKHRNSVFEIMMDSTRLAIEAQSVINMRMMLFAFGGPQADREKKLMVEEKLKAAGDTMAEFFMHLAMGGDPASVVPKAIKSYRKIVGKNHKRLSGR